MALRRINISAARANGAGRRRQSTTEGAMRRWRVSAGKGRDTITPIDRGKREGARRLKTRSEAQPWFIGQHRNLLSRQQA